MRGFARYPAPWYVQARFTQLYELSIMMTEYSIFNACVTNKKQTSTSSQNLNRDSPMEEHGLLVGSYPKVH
jgi:hypothetical protein